MAGSSPAMTWVFVALPLPAGKRARSKPQHGLRDDVALDLVRAAIDRHLAVIEIGRRDGRGPVALLVAAVVAFGRERHRKGTRHLEQELGQRLLDFRALDLEDR